MLAVFCRCQRCHRSGTTKSSSSCFLVRAEHTTAVREVTFECLYRLAPPSQVFLFDFNKDYGNSAEIPKPKTLLAKGVRLKSERLP